MNTLQYLEHTSAHNEGINLIYAFPNGYGASVVKHHFSYGGAEGNFEIAILDSDGYITYDAPITDDVLGNIKPEHVEVILTEIMNMPKAAGK